MLNDKHILITGGTGSFGKAFARYVLRNFKPKRLIIYSRDEYKQAKMMEEPIFKTPCMRFFLGDVRDYNRLTRAMIGVDYAIHAAALKQVPAAEYNPNEFIQTNIIGTTNVCEAALTCNVSKVLALSTDKAVTPINLYGATKLCAEKSCVASNSYAGSTKTSFSVVRYGNVFGSRGSVIPVFLKQREEGVVSITDVRMTRFLITLEDGVKFVLKSLGLMQGGEIFVPKLPSCRILDIARAIAPNCTIDVVGIRPGEKLHETLIPVEESRSVYDCGEHFVIAPMINYWRKGLEHNINGSICSNEFSYVSNENTTWLTHENIMYWLNNYLLDQNKCTQKNKLQKNHSKPIVSQSFIE